MRPRSSPRARIIAVSGGFIAIAAAITMSIIRAREARNVATYGSARWAEDKEIHAAGLLGPDGVVLGRLRARTICAMTAPSMSCASRRPDQGKGVGLVVPTLLTWPGSCIVHDIKGENWNLTAGFRAKHGRVLLFDPTNAESSAYNPLLEVRRGEWEVRDVQNIADILVDPEGSSTSATIGKRPAIRCWSARSCMSSMPRRTRRWPASPTSCPIRSAPVEATLRAMMTRRIWAKPVFIPSSRRRPASC
jgi:type IV secretion system protein VirD4